MTTTTKFDKDEHGINADIKRYISMIGSLLYLMACPKESHLITVKCIIRYPKGTIEMGLWYPKTGQFSHDELFGCRLCRL